MTRDDSGKDWPENTGKNWYALLRVETRTVFLNTIKRWDTQAKDGLAGRALKLRPGTQKALPKNASCMQNRLHMTFWSSPSCDATKANISHVALNSLLVSPCCIKRAQKKANRSTRMIALQVWGSCFLQECKRKCTLLAQEATAYAMCD